MRSARSVSALGNVTVRMPSLQLALIPFLSTRQFRFHHHGLVVLPHVQGRKPGIAGTR